MKFKGFLKKVLFNIEAKTWRYRKKILFSIIDTEVGITVQHEPDGKKLIVVYDYIKNKPLAELEIETNQKEPFKIQINQEEKYLTYYWVEKYKAYK